MKDLEKTKKVLTATETVCKKSSFFAATVSAVIFLIGGAACLIHDGIIRREIKQSNKTNNHKK